jgi:molybdopterin converting factor subunit 1
MNEKKKIHLKYFALLADATGRSADTIVIDREVKTVAQMLTILNARYPALARYTGPVLVARNRQYITVDTEVSDGDELALFPPVSGG